MNHPTGNQQQQQQAIAWRLDPKESHSDWKIEITHTTAADDVSSSKTDLYHVHKCIMSIGSRQSDYFHALFHDGGRFAETKHGKSTIPLHPLAAAAVPVMLDYIYTGDLQINHENATALHYLGDYFSIPSLGKQVKKFWHKSNVDGKDAATYYRHAQELGDAKVLRNFKNFVVRNIMRVQPNGFLTKVNDMALWKDIAKEAVAVDQSLYSWSAKVPREKVSRHLSQLLAAFIANRKHDLSKHDFQQLTRPDYLPFLDDGKVPRVLLEMEYHFGLQNETELSSLQERSLTAMALSGAYGRLSPTDDCFVLGTQSKLFLKELVLKTSQAVHQRDKERARQEPVNPAVAT